MSAFLFYNTIYLRIIVFILKDMIDLKKYKNKEQLTEIKAGKTGYGLLIEHDGHILSKSDTIRQIREDIDSGHKFVIPDDFIVSAVFQKYGIKNANGRIYPENVLRREVQKYLEEEVANHCAIGALDHPSCQLEDTQVLTESGWKFINKVVAGENVLTVSENLKLEVKPILRTIDSPYKGKLIHLEGEFIDIKVTPNHKFPVLGEDGEWKGFYTAQEIYDGDVPEQNESYLFKLVEHSEGEVTPVDLMSYEFSSVQSLNKEKLSVSEEQYDGRVYCIEVENHTFYTMCNNGKCIWSGNSSSLSGHDVTHNILDLYWEGRTLLGEMKLHLSPGFKRYGICSTSGDLVANMILDGITVGVSSRALGTVEEKYGDLIVNDDLDIIGWDVVIENSTPGAKIAMDKSDLQQYIEGVESKKPLISEKLEKIQKILL